MNLEAVFKMPGDQIRSIIDAMDRRTGSVTLAEVRPAPDGFTVVNGLPQDVMFVIGEIAAQGEATLVLTYMR